MKNKEMNKLRETLSPYEFESTQKNAVNKRFSFMEYLYSGDYIKVIKTFKDYYGFTHEAGENFYFACAYFYLMKMAILYIFQKIKLMLTLSIFKLEQKLKRKFVIT
ncbi:hypothetical protein HMPREF9094_1426 [Fusobacterium animalis ATCC 51191]|uniref:DUF3601 domain-containing protein n=1 Tax=Fusobacterium animalis ATCC 51191 TaxID=997347 RepID=F9ENC1_9FUSO|nr:hypothetical protein HMPREF9094_1426 [Fusobacterium animalis ATCC 51191]